MTSAVPPGIDVALHIGNTREIEERVRASQVDLGIVGGHLTDAKETRIEESVADHLVLNRRSAPSLGEAWRRRTEPPQEIHVQVRPR